MYGNPQGVGILNVAMSGYAKAYPTNQYVADLIAPRVPVGVRSFQYVIFDRSSQRIRPTLRTPGAAPIQIGMNYSTDTYFCNEHAVDVPLPRESQAVASQMGFDLQKSGTGAAMNVIYGRREFEVVTLLKTAVTNVETPSGTDLWDNVASNPVKQIEDANYTIKKSGVPANTLILGPDMVKAARENPAIVAKFQYVQGGVITLDMLALAFGVPKVVEALGVSVDGNDNADFLWKGLAVLAYVQPVASQTDISPIKTFVDTTQGVDGYEVLEWPDPHASKKLDWTSGNMAYDMKVTAQDTIFVVKGGTSQS